MILFLGTADAVFAQSKTPDIFHDAKGDSYHQLFLDFKAKTLLELKYTTDDSLIEGELSVDGFSVILKNYAGDKAVKVKVLNEAGEEKEVSKSKCFIDPVILQL
ncbi:MAG: hypothetical protein IPP71_14870 [Bacteroidetes bacterium]|nr:hypothetical protein [Bacteroidota bacterium]